MPKSDARSLITFFGYNSTGINVKFKFTLSLVSNPAFVDVFFFVPIQTALIVAKGVRNDNGGHRTFKYGFRK